MQALSLTVTDLPRFVPEATYQAYIDRYVEAVRKLDGLVAVYQMGSVSTPGISDVDLIVVVDGAFRGVDYHALSVRRVFGNDETAAYLFIHDVMVVDLDTFAHLGYTHYASNLTCLYGEALDAPELAPPHHLPVRLAILCDFIQMRLHQFEHFRRQGPFLVRGHMVRASSVKHSIQLAEGMGAPHDWSQLVTTIDRVRSTWFNEEDVEQVKTMFNASVVAFRTLLETTAAYFKHHVLQFAEGDFEHHVLMLNDRQRTTFFVDDETYRNGYTTDRRNDVYEAFRRLHPFTRTLVTLPSHLYLHYVTYARTGDNLVQRLIAQKLSNSHISFSVDAVYRDAMEKRCAAIAHHARFLAMNGIQFSNGKPSPGFALMTY